MVRLALIVHLFVGSTLAGIGVIAALVAGLDTLNPILISAVIGWIFSVPASWVLAKKMYELR